MTGATRPSTGIYCLSVDPSVANLVFTSGGAPIRVMVATVEFFQMSVVADAQVWVRGGNTFCGPNRLEVRTFIGATPSNAVSFTVAVI